MISYALYSIRHEYLDSKSGLLWICTEFSKAAWHNSSKCRSPCFNQTFYLLVVIFRYIEETCTSHFLGVCFDTYSMLWGVKTKTIFGLLVCLMGFSWEKICDKLLCFHVHNLHFSTCHIPLITKVDSNGLLAFSYTRNKTMQAKNDQWG